MYKPDMKEHSPGKVFILFLHSDPIPTNLFHTTILIVVVLVYLRYDLVGASIYSFLVFYTLYQWGSSCVSDWN